MFQLTHIRIHPSTTPVEPEYALSIAEGVEDADADTVTFAVTATKDGVTTDFAIDSATLDGSPVSADIVGTDVVVTYTDGETGEIEITLSCGDKIESKTFTLI